MQAVVNIDDEIDLFLVLRTESIGHISVKNIPVLYTVLLS